MLLLMASPPLDLVAIVADLLPKLGGSHIVFSPHNHPTSECCPHFTDEDNRLDAKGGGELNNRPKVCNLEMQQSLQKMIH